MEQVGDLSSTQRVFDQVSCDNCGMHLADAGKPGVAFHAHQLGDLVELCEDLRRCCSRVLLYLNDLK